MKHETYSIKQIPNTNSQGFSMLEVLIGVFVIVVGMMAAISLLSAGLGNSMDSRNQAIAGFLSQEGVELVRNIRDTNWVLGNGTFDGISSGDCAVSTGTALKCSGASFQLYYNPANLRYTHNSTGASATKFSRKLVLENLASNEKKITSEVIWGGVWPASIAACNTKNKCAYSEITLTEWGKN